MTDELTSILENSLHVQPIGTKGKKRVRWRIPNHGQKWTAEQDTYLLRQRANQVSPLTVAFYMGRTETAVVTRLTILLKLRLLQAAPELRDALAEKLYIRYHLSPDEPAGEFILKRGYHQQVTSEIHI